MGRLKGIVFDLDGTLINSNVDFTEMKRRMIRVLEEHGAPKDLLTPRQTTVVILEKAEEVWKEQGKPEAEREGLRAKMDELMDAVELEAIPTVSAMEGAVEAVRRLKEMGYELAVLTRSHCAYAIEALKKTGMTEYFDFILGRGETPKPKPYAEALQHTAECMGLGIDEIVFVGDHHIDFTCAENARCHFIGVRSGPRGAESWDKREPDVLLDGVKDLPGYLSRH